MYIHSSNQLDLFFLATVGKGVKGYLKTALANSEQLLVLVNDIMDAATVARSGACVALDNKE